MKKIVLVILLALCLSGCSAFTEDSYLVIEKHSEPPTEPTETTAREELPTLISNRSQLRGAVLSCIRNWVEKDSLPVENYDGDLSSDLSEVLHHATEEDPFGAYAVDFIDAELVGDAVSGAIEVSIVFRRSEAEVDSIVTVNSTSTALRRIQQALTSYETSLALRIREYDEVDFAAYIREYCLENPNLVLAVPEFSAEVYPPNGSTCILELHFSYPFTRDEMRPMLSTVNTTLTSAASYIRSGETDLARLELLNRFLMTRFRYRLCTEEPAMPAYSLLQTHLAHSLSFAAVFRYECRAVEMDCWMVSGTKNGVPHYWNIVCIDDVYYHIDLMRSFERGETQLTLLSAQELLSEGYAWDTEAYPSNPEPEPTEPTQIGTTPTEPTESTEETEPTEPTESTEPTEESSTEPETSEQP